LSRAKDGGNPTIVKAGDKKVLRVLPSSGEPAKIGRNVSVGPDRVLGEITKLGGEAMTPYLARLLEISLYNATAFSRASWHSSAILTHDSP
jgi:hypothetical protein